MFVILGYSIHAGDSYSRGMKNELREYGTLYTILWGIVYGGIHN